MPASNDEIKAAMSALRDAEKADADATAAKKASETRIAAIKGQYEIEKKAYVDADSATKATAAKVTDAQNAVAKLLDPGVPWTEAGSTIFMVDPEGTLKELTLNYLEARTA
ncbi:hypothetical protein [Singulisphaera sp. PoT]|uniref:hypothetical protein n=1 Tax=Singulisphaera sp. PoT TaxID=3411797 RepID=UPI003BF51D2B